MLIYLGALILLIMYLRWDSFTISQTQARIAKGKQEPEPCPIIPRFCLSDMLAMVFSLGFAPGAWFRARYRDAMQQGEARS